MCKGTATIKERLYWLVCAELALQRGDARGAATMATALLAIPPNHTADNDTVDNGIVDSAAVVARLWLLRAHTEVAQQQLEAAYATLQIARQAAIRQDARPMLWRVEALLGQVQQQRGERSHAEEHGSAARTLIETVAATIPTPTQREHFLQYALRHVPASPATTPLRSAKASFAGLTERERQVAALIAQGKSDREIAEVLVLSKRTASTHVTNILNKLGFSSRSQIAAWTVEKGINKRAGE